MIKRLINFVILMSLIACVAHPARQTISKDVFTFKKFNAPMDQMLNVETGEALFVEGSYIEGEKIRIDEPVDIMIPGSMAIPFPVHIEPGYLAMSRITPSWKYYCAEMSKAAASFPGIGSVIREGDCVGIRISLEGEKHEWTVDNSNYNRGYGETIWSKSMSKKDEEKYQPSPSNQPFKVQSLKQILFDGFYGGQLHFSWEEIAGLNRESREFTFDFSGQPTLVGIKGNQFIIHKADNVKMVYVWKKFD